MVIWLIMFLSALLVPGIMLGVGFWFRKRPPKTINCIWGYRTARSMKNQETWDFAHRKCGEVWVKWGTWLLIFSVIPMLMLLGRDSDTVGMAGSILILLQVIPLLASILPVERALGENFDEDGYRKKVSHHTLAD